MRVYRIEHAITHEGPYVWADSRPGTALDAMMERHNCDITYHPTPRNNGMGKTWDEWTNPRCGFPCLEWLEAWFQGWLNPLHDLDFEIVEVEAEEYQTGIRQTIYPADKATWVRSFPITELNRC
jgi:hypothetical protein